MRVLTVIIVVLLLDLFILFLGRVVTMEANGMEIMRALQAQSTDATPEAQRRVDAAFATAETAQTLGMLFTLGVILLVTWAGFVAAKRLRSKREQTRNAHSDPSVGPRQHLTNR